MDVPPQTTDRLTKGWRVAALLAICLAYANHFGNAFQFDDFHTITDNPALRSLRNLPSYFTDAGTFSVLPANRTYRPIVSASLAVDYALGRGYVPFWFHLSTFLWFLTLCGTLFLLYRALLDRTEASPGNAWLALIGAAWFGLHPAMAETVNYVIQRGDLYCTLGCVAALVLYIERPQWRKYGLYLLPFALALLSKPPAAVFPVLLLFYVYLFEAPEGKGRWKRSLLAIMPAVAVTIAGLMLQSAMTPKTFTPAMITAASYRLAQPYVWMRYFGQLLLPLHLNVDTDLGPFNTFDARALAGCLFLLALVLTIGLCLRKRRLYPIAYGLIWFVVTQLPTSAYTLSEVENDHRMFFSFAGMMIAAVWAAYLLIEKFAPTMLRPEKRSALTAGVVVVLGLYGYGVHVRNSVWHTEESLWRDDVEKSPRNGRGLMIYGLTQMNLGRYQAAVDLYQRALEFTPNYPTLEVNLGVGYGFLHRDAVAEQHYLRSISLAPNDDSCHAFYGRWLMFQPGRLADAAQQLSTAVALNPARQMQHDLLMSLYAKTGDAAALRQAAVETLAAIPSDAMAQQMLAHPPERTAADWVNQSLEDSRAGRFQDAINSAQRALQLDPKMAVAYNNIGASYAALGQWQQAVKAERDALALDPKLQIAQNNLSAFLQKKTGAAPGANGTAADYVNESLQFSQTGKYRESIAAAQKALELDPKSAEAWNNIAAANEAMHHWDEAIAAAQKAIALRPDFQLAKNNLAWSVSQKKAGVK